MSPWWIAFGLTSILVGMIGMCTGHLFGLVLIILGLVVIYFELEKIWAVIRKRNGL